MSAGYIDSSCLVAILLDQPSAKELRNTLRGFDLRLTSYFTVAEVSAALAREGLVLPPGALAGVRPFDLSRQLDGEIRIVLEHGYLRGADTWHLACALALRREIPGLAFLTEDARQQAVATALGFPGLL